MWVPGSNLDHQTRQLAPFSSEPSCPPFMHVHERMNTFWGRSVCVPVCAWKPEEAIVTFSRGDGTWNPVLMIALNCQVISPVPQMALFILQFCYQSASVSWLIHFETGSLCIVLGGLNREHLPCLCLRVLELKACTKSGPRLIFLFYVCTWVCTHSPPLCGWPRRPREHITSLETGITDSCEGGGNWTWVLARVACAFNLRFLLYSFLLWYSMGRKA